MTFSEPIYSTADGSGVIEASDFTLLASKHSDGAESTSAVLSSNTPISLAKNSNIYTLGISFASSLMNGTQINLEGSKARELQSRIIF